MDREFLTAPSAGELVAGRDALSVHAMDGLLMEGVALASIAKAFGTPTWVYGAATIRTRFRRLRAAMPGAAIHYAVKANDHLAVLRILASEGAGADVVSGGELLRALAAGIPASRIVFSGVGKTAEELARALACGVSQINVESEEELEELSALAAAKGAVARVALRVNPDVDAGTHDKISTGRAGDKFGIPMADVAALYARAAGLPGIEPVGLAVHIGSQIHRMASFSACYAKLAALVGELRAAGFAVDSIDCGGGLGIGYADEPAALPEAWAGSIQAAFGNLDVKLAIEPGRWLVAPAGVLVASVIRTKRAGMIRPVVVLDAAMNDLARPAIYGAWHGIVPVAAADFAAPAEAADIVGPVCESADIFARDRPIARLARGSLVAILDCGAYGAVMSSAYNARPAAAQVLIGDSLVGGLQSDAGSCLAGVALIRAREQTESLWATEIVPATS